MITQKQSSDSLGDRMKKAEHQTRLVLPRRCYTLMRFDGKNFHTYTRGFERPFSIVLRNAMDAAALAVCKEASGCRLGYLQSDEITIVLTDFESMTTEAYLDGVVQKLTSILATTVANAFNERMQMELITRIENVDGRVDFGAVWDVIKNKKAKFDARVWTVSDPWEAFNAFKWRQDDATRNAIQMVAQSLYSHKELHGKDQNALQEMSFQKGVNFNDIPTKYKRGSFVIRTDDGWVVDDESPIINQDRLYFFLRVPQIEQPPEYTVSVPVQG
jgi:tRNA(His) 5'-end guanylyltransferase